MANEQAAEVMQPEEKEQEQEKEQKKKKKKKKKDTKKPVKEIVLAALLAAIVFSVAVYGLQTTTGAIEWLPFGGVSSAQKQKQQAREADVEQLTSPSYIAAGDGSGTYYLMDPDLDLSYKSSRSTTVQRIIRAALKDYMTDGSKIKKITKAQYRKAITGNSATAEYSCSIPFDDFVDHNHLNVPSGDKVRYLSRMTLSARNGGSVYLYDREKDDYYKIINEGDDPVVLTGDFVKGLVDTALENAIFEVYARQDYWYGDEELFTEKLLWSDDEKENENAIVGSQIKTVPGTQEFISEFDPKDKEDIARLEKMFFPDGMDFIHKVKSSDGSITYMYGSMKKMLRVDADGSFSYTQELEKENVKRWFDFSPSPDFYDSLALAVDFIREHGGWPSEENEDVVVRLLSSEKIQNSDNAVAVKNEKGYRFTFGLEMGDFTLSYEQGVQMSVDIYGQEVAAYERDLPDMSEVIGTARAGSRGTSDPYEGRYSRRRSTASGTSTPDETDEEESSASGRLSAAFAEGGTALTLKAVIKYNCAALYKELEGQSAEEQESGQTKYLTTDEMMQEILHQITLAEIQLFRMEKADAESTAGFSGKNSSGSKSNGSTGEKSSSENNGQTDSEGSDETEKDAAEWVLVPAWQIRIGSGTYWFNALNGNLLSIF